MISKQTDRMRKVDCYIHMENNTSLIQKQANNDSTSNPNVRHQLILILLRCESFYRLKITRTQIETEGTCRAISSTTSTEFDWAIWLPFVESLRNCRLVDIFVIHFPWPKARKRQISKSLATVSRVNRV